MRGGRARNSRSLKALSCRNRIVNIPAVMFCLGVMSLTAQFAFTREILVLATGNEVTLAVVIATWLVWTGAGAAAGRRLAGKAGPVWWERAGAWTLVFMGCMVPVILVLLRITAGGIGAVPGGYLSLQALLGVTALALMPVCLPAGFLFPCACAAWSGSSAGRGARTVYAAESLGSFTGGALATFGLAQWANGLQVAMIASTAGFLGAAFAARGVCRRLHAVFAVLVLGAAVWPGLPGTVDGWTLARRWERLGVTGDGLAKLVASRDTRYQHLALVVSGGQYTLYADGQVAYSFPDPHGYEYTVHRILAQKPESSDVLVIGGNPAGEIPVLLQYPLRKLVRVELDPAADALIREADPGVLSVSASDPRFKTLYMDGCRYLKSAHETYDVILVRMPEPVTAGINRFYTREFYADAARLLAPGGFLYTSIEASERLEDDALRVAAPVYKALKAVFPHVRVTAGSPMGFFAARDPFVLTLDPDELEKRWNSVRPGARFFQPAYFHVDDTLESGRVAEVERKLGAAPVAVNSLDSPVSCFQMLILWSRYSGSRLESWMRGIGGMPVWKPGTVLLLSLLAVMLLVVRRRAHGARYAACLIMAGVGFMAVALEFAWLYVLQGLYGYVYSQVGFVMGLFMLGVVTGAWLGGFMEKGGAWRVRFGLAAGLVVLFLLAGGLWYPRSGEWTSWGISLLVLSIGWVLGWQFIGTVQWLRTCGLPMAAAASALTACDYVGSAAGGLCTGVLLLPLLGLRATGGLLMGLAAAGLVLFLIVSRQAGETR